MDKQTRPGENEAVASVVLGIVSCVLVVPLFLTAQRYNPILYTAIPAGLSGFLVSFCPIYLRRKETAAISALQG